MCVGVCVRVCVCVCIYIYIYILYVISAFIRTTIVIFFEEPPVFTEKPPSQVEVELGSTLKLCCDAEGSVSWSRAQSSLNLLPAFQQNGCLTITSITEESAGNYICRVTNTFGFAESSTAVIIKG